MKQSSKISNIFPFQKTSFSPLLLAYVTIVTYIIMEPADILKEVMNVAYHERHVISEDRVICKFLLVNTATSTTGERPFAMPRRVKTWL